MHWKKQTCESITNVCLRFMEDTLDQSPMPINMEENLASDLKYSSLIRSVLIANAISTANFTGDDWH